MRRARADILDRPLAIVDTETTGTSPAFGRIIEVAILRVEGGRVVKTFHSLVNPERSLPAAIESITGLSTCELERAPLFSHVAGKIREILDGAIFVAHNAAFDYGFLKSEFRRLGRPFRAHCLCTVKLSRKLFPEFTHHDLSSIISRFNISCEQRHRALDDARALHQFLLIACERQGEQRVGELAGELTSGSIPVQLDRRSIDALPDSPGVYLFHGPDHSVLYVGKSCNIRRRVLSHFSDAHTTTREMRLCQEVLEVEARTTAGELGALLLEARLIKQLQPMYNRVARQKKRLVVLKRALTPEGYATVAMEYADTIAPSEIPQLLTIFKNRKQAVDYLAEIAKIHNLCYKLLGLEETSGCCFQYHLHRCHGACLGEEDPVLYNVRFEGAFVDRRIKGWPFRGGVVVQEKAEGHDEGDAFLINHWCLLSTVRYHEDGSQEVLSGSEYFDYDGYKILLRFFKEKANRTRIRNVPDAEFKALLAKLDPESYLLSA